MELAPAGAGGQQELAGAFVKLGRRFQTEHTPSRLARPMKH